MKMKSIFLSMLAIAALASCTQENFNVDPLVPQGEKMLVNITLTSGEPTKAGGVVAAADDKVIDNVTVFFLNAKDQIVSKQYLNSGSLTNDETDATKKTATVETRSTATQMMVIANIGENRTASALNVSTKAQLKAVVQSLITTDTSPLPVQVKGDVFMSGEGTVDNMTADPNGGPSTATSAVTLNFVAAKITLASISLGPDVQGAYGTDFKFTRAFLLNVQTNSWYFPTTGSYIPDPKAYANGVAWEASWGTDPGYPVVADFNQSLTSIAGQGDLPKTDIAHWYVFENNPASVQSSEHPTTLVIEIEWTKTKAAAGVEEEKEKKMFNVIFAPGDKGAIKAGQAYNVALTFNGDFRPENNGGNGGGGTDTPDEPNVNANVGITVTPASWAVQETPKPF